jgi:hypothetical protein
LRGTVSTEVLTAADVRAGQPGYQPAKETISMSVNDAAVTGPVTAASGRPEMGNPGSAGLAATTRIDHLHALTGTPGREQVMNRSRSTGRILRLAGVLAGLAAVRAVSLARATATTVLPVLLPLDQGAPPVFPGRIPLSWYR